MEINNRTVRLLSQTNNFTDENLWSFFEENFDLKLKSKQFLLKNKFILLDYNIIKALKNYDIKVKRTIYPNWEKADRISAILYIKKI